MDQQLILEKTVCIDIITKKYEPIFTFCDFRHYPAKSFKGRSQKQI